MKRAFTLIELLLVVGIMGLLGTVSVGGYQQMRRGMEEKGVIQDVNTLIRAAYQRAQIDRQPTAVVFWNETLRGENDANGDENMIVVGHAVAIRRSGRITAKVGSYLLDEFADLELSYQTDDGDDGSSGSTDAGMYLYPMDDLTDVEQSSSVRRSLVDTKVYAQHVMPVYLTGPIAANVQAVSPGAASSSGGESSGQLKVYAFKVSDANGVNWKAGMAYGVEFAHLVLPHNYFFGSGAAYSTSSDNPLREAGALAFDVGKNIGTGMTSGNQAGLMSRTTVQISAFRLGSTGTLVPQVIGTSAKPTDELK